MRYDGCSKTCKVIGCWHHTQGGRLNAEDGQSIFFEALAEARTEQAFEEYARKPWVNVPRS